MKIKKLSTLIIACYASFLMVLPGTAQVSNLFNKREKFTYRGTVRDSLADFPISQTVVSIKNTRVSTVTDEQGKFSILTNLGPEIILLFNKSGYLEKPYLVDSANTVKVFLLVENGLEQPDLFTPAKKQDHHLTSPVTVEKIEYNDLQSSPSFTFFQSLGHLKGVDLATSGLQMQSINYQGLGGATNPRFMYLIDGMDNQIPGEGFTMGNITGISELEIQTAELVAGPSSILYGANAYNGLLSVKSKSPFDYKGLSGLVKYGVNHIEGVDGTEAAPIYEFGLRYATAFKDLVALKLGYSRFSGTDWQGSDISNARPGSEGQGTRDTEPGYDGVNVYGDESSSVFPFGLSGSDQLVTRTGYNEKDLVEYDVDSEKFDFALHTKITNGVEAIIQLQHGEGNTLFYGNNRSVIQDLEMDKFKFEVKGNHFFLRRYTVTHTYGRNYDALLLGRELNLSVKGNTSWFKDYGSLFNSPPFDQNTHNQARLFADGFGLNESGFSLPRTQPDDPNFEIIKNNIIDQNGPGFSPPILVQLENDTKLTHNEVFYDFKHLLGFVGIQIGVMNRKYELNQLTTLINNVLNLDDYNEGAVYGQVYKDLFYDKLKISVSFRQHDNGIFGSDFFPGANAVYSLPGNHHFRLSYRTGFRNPTLQEMFISKDIGPGSLQGGLLDLTTVTIPQQGNPNGLPITITGNTIFLKNVNNFGIAVDREVGQGIAPDSAVNNNTDILLDGIVLPGDLRPLEIEKIERFEIGYKSIINGEWFFDFAFHQSLIKNFIGQVGLVRPITTLPPAVDITAAADLVRDQRTRQDFFYYQNANNTVTSRGLVGELQHLFYSGLFFGGNASWSSIDMPDDELVEVPLNTPEFKANVWLGHRRLFKKVGFKAILHWQESYEWTGALVKGPVPGFTTIDAQVSYPLPFFNSVIKIGATNLFNQKHTDIYGGANIGAIYYVSILVDELFTDDFDLF